MTVDTGRRRFLLGSASLAGLAAISGAAHGAGRRWTIPYGSAVRPGLLVTDPAYRAALVDACSIVVPEGGLKWADIRPTREAFDFEAGDFFVDFAAANAMAIRGHALVWAGAMPAWTASIGAAEAEGLLVEHVQAVVARYAGRIASWDVVNEPIAEDRGQPGDLRPSIWLDRLGPSYIAIALRAAAAADPSARLVLNEYGLEHVGGRDIVKREAFLALLRQLRQDDVPLHGVGLQGHLRGDRSIDRDALGALVRDVAALGLSVTVTELDVIDAGLPGPADAIDTVAASRVDDFLGAIFAQKVPDAVLTWGLTDRYSWVPTYFARRDGTPNRPLPLDDAYRPKAMMRVIERYCR